MFNLIRPYTKQCLILIALVPLGCSLLFGNIKPTEEKSKKYSVIDLSSVNPDWIRLNPETSPNTLLPSNSADESFQSKKNHSVISVNSACKSYSVDHQQNLSELTRELLLGMTEISHLKETKRHLNGMIALDTTLQAKSDQNAIMLRVVILQQENCIYDLMYISRIEAFSTHEQDFNQFIASLKLK